MFEKLTIKTKQMPYQKVRAGAEDETLYMHIMNTPIDFRYKIYLYINQETIPRKMHRNEF